MTNLLTRENDDRLNNEEEEELDDALDDTFPASDPLESEQPGGDKLPGRS